MLKLSVSCPRWSHRSPHRATSTFQRLKAHLRSLRAAGVSGWVPCGSSGEYNLMSDDERDRVLQFVRNFATPGETLIAGTNAPSTAGVIANTKRAKALGYHAVLLAVPFYTKPSQAEIVQHFTKVIEATDMDVVLYSYPGKDGVEIGYEALDALADNPRIIGIKESSGVLAAGHRDFDPLHGAHPAGFWLRRYCLGFHALGCGQLDLRPGELHGQAGLRNGCGIPQGRARPRQGNHAGALAGDERAGVGQVRSEAQVWLRIAGNPGG